MVDIKTTIKAMCSAVGGQRMMAARMYASHEKSHEKFRNHFDQKCGSRFFTLEEIERMEDISGTSFFAEYAADRVGKLLVDIPVPDELDNVELHRLNIQADAARGELAAAQIEISDDVVLNARESGRLWGLLRKSLRYQIHGLAAFVALHGGVVFDDGGLMSANSMVVPQLCRSGTPFAKTLCVEN